MKRRVGHLFAFLTITLILAGCGSGGALGQLVTAAFSPQAAVSDLQIKGIGLGGLPISDILGRFIPKVQPIISTTPTPDGFPESAQEQNEQSDPVPAALPGIPPGLAAILTTALEEKYLLDVALVGQKKTIKLVCTGAEEIARCKKVPINSPIRASVVPLDGNIYDLRRIVED